MECKQQLETECGLGKITWDLYGHIKTLFTEAALWLLV